jgi:hypothetical protein
MKTKIITLISLFISFSSFSQDCTFYHDGCEDWSGNNNHGSLSNTEPTSSRCNDLPEMALYFNGNNSHMDIPSSNYPQGNGDVSLSFWFLTESLQKQTLLFIGSFIDSNFIKIYIDNSNLGFQVKSRNWITNWSCPLNQWNHITFTKKDTVVKLFINGFQVDSTTIPALSIQDQSIKFGYDSTGEFFKGKLDQAKIYKYCLPDYMVWIKYLNVSQVSNREIDSDVIKLYPNPTKDFFIVESVSEVLIWDSFGRAVNFIRNQNQISVMGWQKGIYVVRCGNQIKKLVVE